MNNSLAEDPARQTLMKRAGIASLIVAITLIAIKAFALTRTNSVSIFASLVDSSVDTLASLINFTAIRYALNPPDHDHRYGHGKAEAVSSLAQAGFITASALFLLVNGVNRLITPKEIHDLNVGLGVMYTSLALTIGLVLFQRHVVKKTNSTAIKADSIHYISDILSNGLTLAALYLSSVWLALDAIIGLAIGLFILKSAWDIVKEALNILLDKELPKEIKTQIGELIRSHKKVYGFHDLRTRQSGIRSYIQFHVELEDEITIFEAHKIVDQVEQMLKESFPDIEAL
ncbi:MAG: cation diffusion facilitator family transporter, partial [Lentisphaeraceae bacterium]|nr:cation diffusion facilitator family transporter [Lentisphaeraceae bacterium]